jgi:uncharacterized membrane protein
MLLALIIIGFAMITLGVALLFLGEVPFIAGKRISAWRSRLIGLVLVSFLPLALGARQASNAFFGPDAVEGPVLTWVLLGFCWFVVFLILFRVIVPKKATRGAKSTPSFGGHDPFDGAAPAEGPLDVELVEEEKAAPSPKKAAPSKKPAVKKAPKPPVEDENPFDFS